MKLQKIGLPLLFLVSSSAFATPELFTQTFDISGVNYTLNFTADDTSPTTITGLTNSFVGTDALILLTPGHLGGNDNFFDPTMINPALGGGWNSNGVSFEDTVTGMDYNLYGGGFPLPYYLNGDYTVNVATANFTTTTAPVTVDEPATLGLFAMAALAALGNRRRTRRQPV